MNDFKRIFEYIWPQWPRIVVVVITALVVAMLLSVSFLTAIPLLRVLVGGEGLHSWVDRKTCEYRYGVEFYVPDAGDLTSGQSRQMATTLQVTKVQAGSLAAKAGLEAGDRILRAGDQADANDERVSYASLMEKLATTDANEIEVRLLRVDDEGDAKRLTVELATVAAAGEGEQIASFKRSLGMAAVAKARSLVSHLDREKITESKTKAVILIMLLVLALTVIRCFAKYYQTYMAQKIVQVGINELRQDAFVHMMNMPVGYFAGDRASDIVSRLVRDTGSMAKGVKILLGKALREPLNAAFLLATAMFLNWQLTVVFLCSGPAVLWLVVSFGRKMKKATRKSLVAWSQMLGKLQETVSGLKVVKVYNRQEHEEGAFGSINSRLLKQLLKMSRVDAATSPVLEVMGMMAGSAAIIFGAHWVSKGNIDGGSFMVLIAILGTAADAVRKTSDIWNNVQEANAAAERVFAIMDEPLEMEQEGAAALPRLNSTIEVRNVVFSYPEGERAVLNGVNLKIRAGDNVAIVGPNGSGKTTLVNMIPRFYDPDSGMILIDGRNIRDYTLKSLRQQIAMVTQNVVTFNDTIAANIGYGRPGATRQEIVEAAKRAFAHEFIEPLAAGYDTIIGEQGTGLSGGQLQRIVIARAILKDPAILIFDEATSQVDADSEAKIHKAIEEVMSDRTSLIIAHRFSTVISADTIVVMDKGRVIDQGRHSELTERCPLYRSLYETQLVQA